jgi:hypothetical protein
MYRSFEPRAFGLVISQTFHSGSWSAVVTMSASALGAHITLSDGRTDGPPLSHSPRWGIIKMYHAGDFIAHSNSQMLLGRRLQNVLDTYRQTYWQVVSLFALSAALNCHCIVMAAHFSKGRHGSQ